MYEEKGRAQGILRDYLKETLRSTLTPQEREAASHLLIALVSSDQRRIRRTTSDLVATLATHLSNTTDLGYLLNHLVESRLVNVEEDEQTGEPAYELVHDYLLTEIEVDPETQARKAAEELLKQEVEAYKRHRTLLSIDKFNIINSQRKFLMLNEIAEELLRRSQEALEAEAREKEAQRQCELEQQRALAEEQRRRAEEQTQAAANLRRRAIWIAIVGGVATVLAIVALIFGSQSSKNAIEPMPKALGLLPTRRLSNPNGLQLRLRVHEPLPMRLRLKLNGPQLRQLAL
jgi:hypothetical protein